MNCPKCGRSAAPGAEFCLSCGTRLNTSSYQEIDEQETSVLGVPGNQSYSGSQSQSRRVQPQPHQGYQSQPHQGYQSQSGGYNPNTPPANLYNQSQSSYRMYGQKSQSNTMSIVSKVLLGLGALCLLIGIAGWFMTGVSVTLSGPVVEDGQTFEQMAHDNAPTDPLAQKLLDFTTISGNTVSIGFDTLTDPQAIQSLAKDTPVKIDDPSDLSLLRNIKIVYLILAVAAVILMIVPMFVKQVWAKFLPLASVIVAIIGVVVFMNLNTGVSALQMLLTVYNAGQSSAYALYINLSLGIGAWLLMILPIVALICGIVPMFLKNNK